MILTAYKPFFVSRQEYAMTISEIQTFTVELFERMPYVVIALFTVIWLSGGIAIFLFLFSPKGSGAQIVQGAGDVGLTVVESRGVQNPLPADRVFASAKREIALSGVSAYRTFDQTRPVLKELLGKGIKLYVMILSPDSVEAARLSLIEKKSITEDIHNTLTVLSNEKFVKEKGFEIRFFDVLPPFTAVMIDGDVDPTGGKPTDAEGSIRVQPRTASGSQHQGVILTFRNTGQSGSGYENFSADFRLQWKDARSRDELLNQP